MRKFVSFWCAVSVAFGGFFFPVRDVYAITIPTRQISPGVFAYAPSTGAQIFSAIASGIGRVNPWIAGASLGIEVAKMMWQTSDGTIGVTTLGKKFVDGDPSVHVNSSAVGDVRYALTGAPGGTTYVAGIQPSGAVQGWFDSVQDPNNVCTITGQTFGLVGTPWADTVTYHCVQGQNGVANYFAEARCAFGNQPTYTQIGTDPSTWMSTVCAPDPDGGQASGGSKYWTPRPITMPDGSTQMGWESPSDPTVSNPNNMTPSDTYAYPAQNGVQGQATATPNPDGGYTVQTYSPEFTNPAAPTTQTGWTVQTMTVNNAGNVTNVTITTNNQSGPPNTHPPTVSAGTPTPTNSDGTPQTPPANLQCGSLNCESTQQGIHTDTTAIKNELTAAGAPTLPDQAAAIATAKSDDLSSLNAAKDSITFDGSSWTAWVWTPPAGTCEAPTASLSHGISVSFNYCPMVDNIKAALGWLFAIFASWHIWNVLFRRE